MDIAIEIIMLIFVAPLIEILLTAFGSFIANRIKWHPFKEKFNRQVEGATDAVFTMTYNPETKAALVFALVCAILAFILNIVLYTGVYASNGMALTDYIIVEIVSQALILPMLLCALHYSTKKFCFTENEIIIKSAIYFKRVRFGQITSVTEINHSKLYLALKIEYNKEQKNKSKIRKFKIVQTFGNYERAKKRFSDMQLIK